MRNRVLLVLLAMVLVVSMVAFAACGEEEEPAPPPPPPPPVEEEEEPPPPPPPPEEVWEWPEKLLFATQSPASSAYALLIAWTTPLADDTGMNIRIMSEDSIILKNNWLHQGMYFCSSVESVESTIEAIGDFATRDGGPFQVRGMYAASETNYGLAVRGDSGLETPYDLKPGMKIIYFTFAPTGKLVMEALLAWANLTPDDVEWIPVATLDASARALMDGKGDVMFGFPGSPAQFEIEASPHGLAWLDLNAEEDPEGAARFIQVFPTMSIFGPMKRGVPSAIGKWGPMGITIWGVHADADTELVYNIVKWLDENYEHFKDAHPSIIDMTIETTMAIAETDFVPLHDGVAKYLQEKGIWTAAHEARRQQNIDLITRYIEAYQTAIDMADAEGIRIDPQNEEWIELWENYKKELGLPKFKKFQGLD
jgi:hypothetical protein